MTDSMKEFYELEVLIDICMAEYRVDGKISHLEEAQTYLHLLKEGRKKYGETIG